MVLMAFIGIWLLRAGVNAVVRLHRGTSALRSGFADLTPGLVALRGRVVPIDPLVSAETGRVGVYLAYTADRWQKSASLGGIAGHWVRAEADEAAAPFEVADGEASVLVDPKGARVLARESVAELSQPDGVVVCYRESLIEVGEEVLILGRASHHGGFDSSSAFRGHTFRVVVSEALIGAPSIVLRSTALAAAGQLLGAIGAIAAAVFLLSRLG